MSDAPTSDTPILDNEAVVRVQQFAEQALDEITRRAGDGGMDPLALHSALCVATVGWLANHVGAEHTAQMLDQLATVVRTSPPEAGEH